MPLHQIAETINKKGLIILISDLLDDPAAILRGLQHFRFKGHDVIIFHIMDETELTFPFKNATKFVDMEGDSQFMAIPSLVRDNYMKKLRAHMSWLKRGCGRMHVDYHLLETSKPLDFALFSYLNHRSRKD